MNFNKKLPVFFHIPKCAGTYINNRCFSFMQQYAVGKKHYHIDLLKSGHIFYRLLCYSKDNLGDEYKRINNTCLTIDFKDFEFGALDIFMIRIADRGFETYKQDIYSSLPDFTKLYEFLCLRDPYSRTKSLYSYIQSAQSANEDTHKSFGEQSFIDYLNSPQLEGSWLIRKFLKIPNHIPVSEEHFKKTCEILDGMHIIKMNNIENSLHEIFGCCYDMDFSSTAPKAHDNKTKNKISTPFNSLDEKTQAAFLNQTKWDKRIFNKYVY